MTPDNAVMVDGQLLIEALSEQRNKAMTDLAVAVSRSLMFQRKCAALDAKVQELEARLADAEGLEKHIAELRKQPKEKKEPSNARAH